MPAGLTGPLWAHFAWGGPLSDLPGPAQACSGCSGGTDLEPWPWRRCAVLPNGEITAQPGPFAGPSGRASTAYAVINAADQQDAVVRAGKLLDLHKRHCPEWSGGSEVREIFGTQD